MKLRHLLFSAVLMASATQAWAQGNFSDTSMGVRDGPWVSNPGGGKGSRDVNKIIVNVGHFDVWDYGSNFFNIDILFSNANEPANNSAGGPSVSIRHRNSSLSGCIRWGLPGCRWTSADS